MARQLLPQLEYRHAVQRARHEDLMEPRACAAHYDRTTGQVVVKLKNGATFAFPSDLAQGLAGAAEEDLGIIEISPSGAGLHWPALNADFSLTGLISGVFGTETWMRRLRRQATLRNRKPR